MGFLTAFKILKSPDLRCPDLKHLKHLTCHDFSPSSFLNLMNINKNPRHIFFLMDFKTFPSISGQKTCDFCQGPGFFGVASDDSFVLPHHSQESGINPGGLGNFLGEMAKKS